MKSLHTVDEVIDALGGHKRPADNNKSVAAWLGIGTSAVCNWRDRASIPPGYHLKFYREAQKLGFEIAPSVLSLDSCEASPAAKKKSGSAPSGKRLAKVA